MSNDTSDANVDDLHTLPTQTQALYQRLLDDGASWRTTAELSNIGERLRERAHGLTLLQERQGDSAAVESPFAEADRTVARSHLDTERHVQHSARPFPRRMSVWFATASVILIVGALAALLLSATRGRPAASNGTTPTTSAKATANATVTLAHGRWVSLDSLATSVEFDANDLPAIAPSDPHVVYQTLARGIQQHLPATLRRTDDGGVTWHDLPVPVPTAHVGHAGFLVSPLDARTVFLTLIDTQAEDCPPGTAQSISEGGGVLCWLQYTSTDGGAHWKATKLPGSGWITPNLTNNSATALQVARGFDGQPRLYALLNCPFGVTTCSRLIVSADSGLSWSYADASLLAAGATNVCSTAADSRSATVYAVTTADVECGWNRQKPLTLWRSEDAGAHWTNAGALGTPNLRGLQVTHDTATGRALLYATTPRTTQTSTDKQGGSYPLFSADPSDLKVSADGGRTWTSAPSTGIPALYMPYYDIGMLGVLSDGSVVIQGIPQAAQGNFGASILLAWKPSDKAWRQLAPPVALEIGALTAIPSASPGADTLYLVLVDRSGLPGLTYTFLRYDPLV